MAAHEFCRQCGKPIIVTLRPAVVDRDVLAFDVAGFLQTLAECANEVRIRSGRSAMKITDHWNNQLLRARRERPRRRTAEQSDEVAAFHSRSLPCFRPRIAHLRTAEDCCLYPTLGETR